MNKKEYLSKLDELNLDKDKFCIIGGGVLLLHGLKETTNDIYIQILPDYFKILKTRFKFKKSNKYPNLYELNDYIEVCLRDFSSKDIDIVDGYPVETLEKELEWKKTNNREKDKEDIIKISEYIKHKITN